MMIVGVLGPICCEGFVVALSGWMGVRWCRGLRVRFPRGGPRLKARRISGLRSGLISQIPCNIGDAIRPRKLCIDEPVKIMELHLLEQTLNKFFNEPQISYRLDEDI